MPRFFPLALLAFLVLALAPAALAERKVALVIGNSAYKHVTPLANPANDARLIAESLKSIGFELVGGQAQLNLADEAAMKRAIQAFGEMIKGGGVGLFFYAGHGLQVDGKNYLVPTAANVNSKTQIKYQLVDADYIMDEMSAASTKINVVILDACRNNPFGDRGLRDVKAGLASVIAPTGTLVAYSTAPGRTALDGAGKNSPYTEALSRHIKAAGQRIEDVFISVNRDVAKATGGEQSPWKSDNLTDVFCLSGLCGAAPVAAKPLDLKAEKKRLADEAAQLMREKDELTQVQALQAEKARLTQERQMVEQAKLQALAPVGSPGQTWRDPATGMEFVSVPKGCFKMGSPNTESGRSDHEGPVHEACISALWVGKYSVTVGQFRKFVQATGYKTDAEKQGKAWGARDGKWEDISGLNWQNPGSSQDDRHPAVAISWDDAQAYAQWLSGQGNGRFRLLTEAEWEYAARAGTTASRFWGDSPDGACKFANVYDKTSKRVNGFLWELHNCDDGYAQTSPVGSFRPNAFGLYDMLGNVWQWCEDVYDAKAYESHARDNPMYTGGGARRVRRGGSWYSAPKRVRAASRRDNAPDYRDNNLGFRLARSN